MKLDQTDTSQTRPNVQNGTPPPSTSFSSIPLERRRIRLFSTLHLLLSRFTFSTFLIPCSFAQPINQLQPNIQFSPPSSRSICHLLVLLLLPSLPKFGWWNNSRTFFDGRPSGGGELSYFWSAPASQQSVIQSANTLLLLQRNRFGWEVSSSAPVT